MANNYYRIIKVYVQSNTYNVLAAGSELTASVRYEPICKALETIQYRFIEDGFENSRSLIVLMVCGRKATLNLNSYLPLIIVLFAAQFRMLAVLDIIFLCRRRWYSTHTAISSTKNCRHDALRK